MKTTDSNHLFERSFKSHAEYHGDELSRTDAANAKRVATALKTAAINYRFESLLETEQLLALKAATNVMSNLAHVLDEVCILSKRHFKKCEAARQLKAAQQKAQREAVLDAAAAARWSGDAQMLVEAEDLTAFFKDGGSWLERRRGSDCRYLMQPEIDVGQGPSDSSYRIGGLINARKKEPTTAASCALRRHMVAAFEALAAEDNKRRDFFHRGCAWRYPGLADFDAWLVDRADRKRAVALAIGSAG